MGLQMCSYGSCKAREQSHVLTEVSSLPSGRAYAIDGSPC